MDEAVAWVKRCPNPMPGPSEIEIRPVYEMADFGEALTPEVAELHERVREGGAVKPRRSPSVTLRPCLSAPVSSCGSSLRAQKCRVVTAFLDRDARKSTAP